MRATNQPAAQATKKGGPEGPPFSNHVNLRLACADDLRIGAFDGSGDTAMVANGFQTRPPPQFRRIANRAAKLNGGAVNASLGGRLAGRVIQIQVAKRDLHLARCFGLGSSCDGQDKESGGKEIAHKVLHYVFVTSL